MSKNLDASNKRPSSRNAVIATAGLGAFILSQSAGMVTASDLGNSPLSALAGASVANAAETAASAVTISNVTIDKTTYDWSTKGVVGFDFSGINPNGTQTVQNGDTTTVTMGNNGIGPNFTGAISVKDAAGNIIGEVTKVNADSVKITWTNVQGLYNLAGHISFPVNLDSGDDPNLGTATQGGTYTYPLTLTQGGVTVSSGVDLTVKYPTPYIGDGSYPVPRYNATTGIITGPVVGAAAPSPATGVTKITVKIDNIVNRGLQIDCTDPALANVQVSNPSLNQFGFVNMPKTAYTLDSCSPDSYTISIPNTRVGDQFFASMPGLYTKNLPAYTVFGDITHPGGTPKAVSGTGYLTGYDANANFTTGKLDIQGYIADSDPAAPTGTTADNQDSDADTTAVAVVPGTYKFTYVVKNTGTTNIPDVTVSEKNSLFATSAPFALAVGESKVVSVDVPVGTDPQTLSAQTNGLSNTVTASDDTMVQGYAKPVAGVSLKTLLDGQDANDAANPYVTAPGTKTGVYEVTNTATSGNLTAENTVITGIDGKTVEIPVDFVVAPGETKSIPFTVDLPKQGIQGGEAIVTVSIPYTYPAVLGGDGVVKSSATDPAYIKAATSSIDLVDDVVEVPFDGEVTFPILGNDTSDAAHPLLTDSVKVADAKVSADAPAGSTVTVADDGKSFVFTSGDSTVTVTINADGTGKVVSKGWTGALPVDVTYSATNDLGDVTEPAAIKVTVGAKPAEPTPTPTPTTSTPAPTATPTTPAPVVTPSTTPSTPVVVTETPKPVAPAPVQETPKPTAPTKAETGIEQGALGGLLAASFAAVGISVMVLRRKSA